MVPASARPAVDSVSVALPDASLARCEAPEVIYRRSFNRPTGLGAQTVVLLISELLPLACAAHLNGHPLTLDGSGQVEITAFLQAHNELLISLQHAAYLAASQAAASLQIIEPA